MISHPPASSRSRKVVPTCQEFGVLGVVEYYGYRYYHPELGRWISRDPIGERGGVNFYVFIGNRPNMILDKFGLDITLPFGSTDLRDANTSVIDPYSPPSFNPFAPPQTPPEPTVTPFDFEPYFPTDKDGFGVATYTCERGEYGIGLTEDASCPSCNEVVANCVYYCEIAGPPESGIPPVEIELRTGRIEFCASVLPDTGASATSNYACPRKISIKIEIFSAPPYVGWKSKNAIPGVNENAESAYGPFNEFEVK